MTSMNEPEVVTSLLEQIDKLTEEANRYRTALQDIREGVESDSVIGDRALTVLVLANEALEGE